MLGLLKILFWGFLFWLAWGIIKLIINGRVVYKTMTSGSASQQHRQQTSSFNSKKTQSTDKVEKALDEAEDIDYEEVK